MKVQKTICDRETCNKESALLYSVFSHRAMDGAGSSENWFIQFDLCPEDTVYLLRRIFEDMDVDKVNELLKEMKVKTRIE